jgi:hypothetical protein
MELIHLPLTHFIARPRWPLSVMFVGPSMPTKPELLIEIDAFRRRDLIGA